MVQWFSSRFYEGMFVGFNKEKKENKLQVKCSSSSPGSTKGCSWVQSFFFFFLIASQMVQCFSSRFYEGMFVGFNKVFTKKIKIIKI